MLEFIYRKIVTILEVLGRNQRSLDAIQSRLERIERKIDNNARLLEEIRDTINPGQAVGVNITAGPVTEQQE